MPECRELPGSASAGTAGSAFARPGTPSNPRTAATARVFIRIGTSKKPSLTEYTGAENPVPDIRGGRDPEAPREIAVASIGVGRFDMPIRPRGIACPIAPPGNRPLDKP
jgi:hypothetical protein